jgi:hypothetical protein
MFLPSRRDFPIAYACSPIHFMCTHSLVSPFLCYSYSSTHTSAPPSRRPVCGGGAERGGLKKYPPFQCNIRPFRSTAEPLCSGDALFFDPGRWLQPPAAFLVSTQHSRLLNTNAIPCCDTVSVGKPHLELTTPTSGWNCSLYSHREGGIRTPDRRRHTLGRNGAAPGRRLWHRLATPPAVLRSSTVYLHQCSVL